MNHELKSPPYLQWGMGLRYNRVSGFVESSHSNAIQKGKRQPLPPFFFYGGKAKLKNILVTFLLFTNWGSAYEL